MCIVLNASAIVKIKCFDGSLQENFWAKKVLLLEEIKTKPRDSSLFYLENIKYQKLQYVKGWSQTQFQYASFVLNQRSI